MWLLRNIPAKDRILFVFGEIDCRVGIYNQYMRDKQAKPIEDYVKLTVARYGEFLKLVQKRKKSDLAVLAVPPVGYWENRLKKYKPAEQKQLYITIHKTFNKELELFCQKNGVKFIGIYDQIATEDDLLKQEYNLDDVHVNQKVIKPIVEELKKVNMWS